MTGVQFVPAMESKLELSDTDSYCKSCVNYKVHIIIMMNITEVHNFTLCVHRPVVYLLHH